MKIGFFGNTNNYPLLLAQAIRKMGHEVILVAESGERLHRPESRYPEFETGYPDWIIDGSQYTEWDYITLHPKIAPLINLLSNCDAFIVNSLGPSLLPLLHHPAIAFLTGSDLSHYANFAAIESRSATWSSAYRQSADGKVSLTLLQDFIQRQRDGIKMCAAVSHMPRGLVAVSDTLLDDIGVTDAKRFFIEMADLDQVKYQPPPHNQPVRIFCATRFTWKLPVELGRSPLDYKGSDIMIRGLGLFFRQTHTPLDIRLVRKGLHVTEAEQLITEEGLAEQVTWLDEMSLTSVWEEFARCDIVFEQLGQSMIGMAGLDALATGRPVIGNARPEEIGPGLPVCQAQTPEEVCAHLKRLVFNPAERERLGAANRQYVEQYCSPDYFARLCLQYLEAALLNRNGQQPSEPDVGHRYYLQRIYNDTQTLQSAWGELQSTQAQLQATQTELQTLRAKLAHIQQLPLVRLARKVTGW